MKKMRAWFQDVHPIQLILLGVVVGTGGAVGAALFHILIHYTTFFFFGHDGTTDFISLLHNMSIWERLLIPTLGGLLVGTLFHYAKVSEAEGEGVPEVAEALAHHHGTIRPIVAPVKIITAAITLGSGGSAGREGPVIQIGSTIGSTIAQWLNLHSKERRLLLTAGAAAAIGGTFGAPIAGVLFTIEILKHRPTELVRIFIVIIAAFTGTFGSILLIGHESLRFDAQYIFSPSLYSILTLTLLATAATAAALLFGKVLSLGRGYFQKITTPRIIKPAVGGFLIGLIGLYLPYIHEPAAYPLMIDIISVSSLPLSFLLLLLIFKMITTSITLGSGGSGGIFAPLLFIGVLVGAICGHILNIASLTTPEFSSILTIVGMAAVFASAAHAPLTAAFIVYEMTNNISLLPVLLLTCLLSVTITKRLQKESVYHIHD